VLDWLEPLAARLGERLWIAPPCSLLHVPVDLNSELALDADIRSWLAFALQKLDELQVLAGALRGGRAAVHAALAANAAALAARRASPRVHNPAVQQAVAAIDTSLGQRQHGYAHRAAVQAALLKLPAYPTTTIGSFPQTAEIRHARSAFKAGRLDHAAYHAAMQAEIARSVQAQEALGLDVLVHGEAERNDMVEYFGEQLDGYAFSQFGWVQSYGSRCGKPRAVSCQQLALAIRAEVLDLDRAGVRVIQIDEAALREGLPLRHAQWQAYLEWAVAAFRLTANGVADATQIHTHMCYSEFNDIIASIAAMDADVITIETSRSDMELLDAFDHFNYPNQICPGVYDIHAPNIPTQEHMAQLMQKAAERITAERLWVNPDCGLKNPPVGRSAAGAHEYGGRCQDAAPGCISTRTAARLSPPEKYRVSLYTCGYSAVAPPAMPLPMKPDHQEP